jgi:hypothetical protein
MMRVIHVSSNQVYDDNDVSLPNTSGVPHFTVSTYTGRRCTPRSVGAKRYQRFSCSTNAKKYS